MATTLPDAEQTGPRWGERVRRQVRRVLVRRAAGAAYPIKGEASSGLSLTAASAAPLVAGSTSRR